MHRHDAHAVDSLFHDRRIADITTLSFFIKPVDKRPERDRSIRFTSAHHVCHSHDIRECLFTSRPVGESGMSTRKGEQCPDSLGDRTVIPPAMKFPQDPKRFGNLKQRLWQVTRWLPERMQCRALAAIREQLRIGEGEEWSSQRRKDSEFIIGPLNRSERVADRFYFLSRMERASANEKVWYLMSF